MSSLSIFNDFQVISMDGANLHEPLLLKYGSGLNSKFFNFNNSSKFKFYNSINLKPKLSSDLYNLDENLWNSVILSKLSDFCFENYKLIIFRDKVIEIVDKSFDNLIFENFILSLKEYEDSEILTSYFNSFGILNLLFRKDKAIVVASLNFDNGWYSVHSGIIFNDTYILFPKANIETSSFNEFMILFKINDEIETACAMSCQDIESLGFDLDENLSLREVFDILKDMRCSISLDEEKFASSIAGMSTKNSEIIVSFMNSFGSTFKSLKKLSYLRKIFRTGKLSSGMILNIITEEIGSESLNISGYTLANVSKICSTEEFDKKVIEEETRK